MPCLSSALPGVNPGRPLLDDEERRSFGSLSEDGEEVGVAAVGDELLVSGDPIAGYCPVLADDGHGCGLEALQVATCLGFGDRVRYDGSICQPAEPFFLLLVGGADKDGVGPQVDGQERRSHSQADLGHLLRDGRDVPSPAAHAPVLFGDEEQLQADLGPEQLTDSLFWKDLACVPLAQLLGREQPLPDLREQIEDHFAFFDR